MSRRVLSLGACLAILLASLLPMSASAHKSVKLGKYACYEYTSYGPLYVGFDLKIKSSTKYVLVKNGNQFFGGGRYVHDGEKLRFKSGHLYNKGWKGLHSVDGSGNHGIKLNRTSNSGVISDYHCSNPK